jgi:TRAP-type C4-dicarboxylate transport system permease small subunit
MIKKLADEIKVALVTGACILGMAIIFKQILHIQIDSLISNGPVYLFIIYIISRRQSKKMKCDKPLYWNLGIIFITVLIIVLYAI